MVLLLLMLLLLPPPPPLPDTSVSTIVAPPEFDLSFIACMGDDWLVEKLKCDPEPAVLLLLLLL